MSCRAMVLAVLVSVALVSASPCDALYYIQGATEYLTTASLASSQAIEDEQTNDLDQFLNGIEVLDTHIVYEVVKEYQGAACGSAGEGDVKVWSRPAGSTSFFGDRIDSGLFTEMYDSTTVRLGSSGFDWWFAIGPDTTTGHVAVGTARYVMGRYGDGSNFRTWYGSAMLIDSTKPSSGIWQVSTSYYPWQTYYDSTLLHNSLLSTWEAIEWNDDDRRGKVVLQLLKVEYDSIPQTVQHRPFARNPQLRVLPGDAHAVVYNPLGRAVAVLPKGMDAWVPKANGYYLIRATADERTFRVGTPHVK